LGTLVSALSLLAAFISQKLAGAELKEQLHAGTNGHKQSKALKLSESISSSGSWPDSIAIIGLSCRFPGAASVEEYWQNLREGRETIAHFSAEELLAAGISATQLSHEEVFETGSRVQHQLARLFVRLMPMLEAELESKE